jgi:anaerobic glycerol-3-phosphate dehydrogenase
MLKELPPIKVDALVIGHGASGLMAASALASQNNNVLVVGKGATATSMSTGCISYIRKDILRQERGAIDLEALARSVHPFNDIMERGSLALEEVLLQASSFFQRSLSDQGLEMTDDAFHFFDMLTNAGTRYSCSIAPSFTASGRLDRLEGGSLALLGIEGHRDLDPRLVAAMCAGQVEGMRARAYWRRLDCMGRGGMTATEAAARFKNGGTQELIKAISDLEEDSVAIPPLFGLQSVHKGMSELCSQSEKNVFELVTPMSLPGLRLQDAMERSAVGHGCHLMKNHLVTRLEVKRERAISALIETPTRRQVVSFNSLILATGDLVGGGLALAGREVVDPFSTFKVGWFGESEPFPGQTRYDAAMRQVVEAGYLVTHEMRLMTKEGKPFENAFGAGSALASFSFPTGVGLGGELLTAWIAAEYAKEGS